MNARSRTTTLGLLLAVALGAMALTAAAAAAKGDWKVEGANTAATVEFQTLEDGKRDFTLLSAVGGLTVEILCKQSTDYNGLLFAPTATESGKGLIEIAFFFCETIIAGKTSVVCEPKEGGLLFKLKFLLIKHKNNTYMLFEPDQGSNLSSVFFSPLCPLGEAFGITGTFALEGLLEEESVNHLMAPVPSALLAGQTEEGVTLPDVKMTFGSSSAKIDLAIFFALNGANAGKKWSAVAL
jgi:hypothetical protein